LSDTIDIDFTTPHNMPYNKKAWTADNPTYFQRENFLDMPDMQPSFSPVTTCGIATPIQLYLVFRIPINTHGRTRLQQCSQVQAGDIDLDGLCSDLQKKARCSGNGAVVPKQDFEAIMQHHVGNKRLWRRPSLSVDCYSNCDNLVELPFVDTPGLMTVPFGGSTVCGMGEASRSLGGPRRKGSRGVLSRASIIANFPANVAYMADDAGAKGGVVSSASQLARKL
jgi:hypothetical protein